MLKIGNFVKGILFLDILSVAALQIIYPKHLEDKRGDIENRFEN